MSLAFDIDYSFNSIGNKSKFPKIDCKLLLHISTLELGTQNMFEDPLDQLWEETELKVPGLSDKALLSLADPEGTLGLLGLV